MANVFDVAQYILEQNKDITSMKLHKLLYYSQAWTMVWDEKVLFENPIQAWHSGPIIVDLYNKHNGLFKFDRTTLQDGKSAKLTLLEMQNIDKVITHYGDKSSQWLSDLIHLENPWIIAHKQGDKTEIKLSDIHEYYSGL